MRESMGVLVPGSRRRLSTRRSALGISLGLMSVATLVALAPVSVAAVVPHLVKVAPYKGGVLPSSSLTTYSCHAVAKQPTAWHFNLKTGIGGGSYYSRAKACSQIPYRLGSQSSASASGSEEVSIAVKIPTGIRNVTAHVLLNYTALIKETAGTVSGACPTTPFSSTSVSYYNGTAWTYYPSVSRPVVYNSSTYFYYYTNNGASGSCSSYASFSGGFVAVIIAANGLAGYGMNGGTGGGASYSFGGNVATYNSTYWSCYNYTLWNYGSWSNGTGGCSNSNQTVHSVSYNYLTGTSGTNTTMSQTGSLSFAMYYQANYSSVSPVWDLFLIPSGSTSASTGGFPLGMATSSLNMATGGNGITLKSITIV